MDHDAAWKKLTACIADLENLEGVVGLLQWDQQVMMPHKAGPTRGEHISLLSRLQHERLTDPAVGEWLAVLEAADELDPIQTAALRNTRRSYDRAVKVSSDLVGRLAQAQSDGFESWMRAREASDFSLFAPALDELVQLTAERCEAIAPELPAYDVLLDEFTPGTTTADLQYTFGRLQAGLVQLLEAMGQAEPLPALDAPFEVARQAELQQEVVQALGYDLGAGRLDNAEHPFTVGMGPGDVRITTHLYETALLSGLGGSIHEAGHAMYEQGLPVRHRGTTVCQAADLGLHESQSRFWENYIGRSLPFFRWLEPRLGRHFPEVGVTAEQLYQGANRVVPGLIRVAADEVTYNLHVIVRFELECALFEGRLAVADLPEAWNERYQRTLGITPASDAQGVLQDVHWSGGMFGYFPSYTLGNLYAVGLAQALLQDQPDLWTQVEAGEFATVLAWLREKVHDKGHLVDAPELVRGVIGEVDLVDTLLDYLWSRHGVLHGVSR